MPLHEKLFQISNGKVAINKQVLQANDIKISQSVRCATDKNNTEKRQLNLSNNFTLKFNFTIAEFEHFLLITTCIYDRNLRILLAIRWTFARKEMSLTFLSPGCEASYTSTRNV